MAQGPPSPSFLSSLIATLQGNRWEVALCPLQVEQGPWWDLVLGAQHALPPQDRVKEKGPLPCPIAQSSGPSPQDLSQAQDSALQVQSQEEGPGPQKCRVFLC